MRWLKEGDGNTKYFHDAVKSNKAKNCLEKLFDVNENEQRAEASKGEVAVAYFNHLFTSSNFGSFNEFLVDFCLELQKK